MMCAGAAGGIACSWPAVGPSVTRTARILQLSFEPPHCLLGQVLHVGAVPLAEQLHHRCSHQLSATSLSVALELMPVAIADEKQLVQFFRLGCGGVGPWGVW